MSTPTGWSLTAQTAHAAECDRLKWTSGAAVGCGLPFSFAAMSSGRGTDGQQRRIASSSRREAVKLC